MNFDTTAISGGGLLTERRRKKKKKKNLTSFFNTPKNHPTLISRVHQKHQRHNYMYTDWKGKK
jgi:hypothetical protein